MRAGLFRPRLRGAQITGAVGRDAGHLAGRLVRLGWWAAAGLVTMAILAAAAPSPEGLGSRTLAARPADVMFRDGLLNGVSSASATDAWALGVIGPGQTLYSLTARWNGTRWARVPSPSPGGRNAFSTLTGVSAVSASDAWAVGSYGTGLNDATLVLRWNGTRWARAPSPNPGYRRAQTTCTGSVRRRRPTHGPWGVTAWGAWPIR